ncbi:hypothetical protein DXG01_005286, partial [Tephrocybe rancida]
PHRISKRNVNSYTLVTRARAAISGEFSARRLRRFTPREGTDLAREQAEVEKLEDEAEERLVRQEHEVTSESMGVGSPGTDRAL